MRARILLGLVLVLSLFVPDAAGAEDGDVEVVATVTIGIAASSVAVAWNGEAFGVVWWEGPAGARILRFARIAPDGAVLDAEATHIGEGEGGQAPSIASAGDGFLIGWQGEGGQFITPVGPDGTPGTRQVLTTNRGESCMGPKDDGYAVAWYEVTGTTHDGLATIAVHLALFDVAGGRVSGARVFTNNTDRRVHGCDVLAAGDHVFVGFRSEHANALFVVGVSEGSVTRRSYFDLPLSLVRLEDGFLAVAAEHSFRFDLQGNVIARYDGETSGPPAIGWRRAILGVARGMLSRGDAAARTRPRVDLLRLPHRAMALAASSTHVLVAGAGAEGMHATLLRHAPDGVADELDNCPLQANADQDDFAADAIGDACADSDGDGVDLAIDNCADVPNADQADADHDGRGDGCDPFQDRDLDGVPEDLDNCIDHPNPDQLDADGDGLGDVCDRRPRVPEADPDGDGVPGVQDNCPYVPNQAQSDQDGDGRGNACDLDADGDAVGNADDNCPFTPNADQANEDRDEYGDACDRRGSPERERDVLAPACSLHPDGGVAPVVGLFLSALPLLLAARRRTR